MIQTGLFKRDALIFLIALSFTLSCENIYGQSDPLKEANLAFTEDKYREALIYYNRIEQIESSGPLLFKRGVCYYEINQLDRAIADEETQGFVKVLTKPGKDKILGVTIVGHHAADLIAKFVLAMKHGLGLKKLLGTLHIYPTLMEINQKTALEWRRSHLPERGLRWLEKYHHWCRGKQSTEHQQNLIKEKKA